MARFDVENSSRSASVDGSGHAGRQELRSFHPGPLSDFWISDLANDLSCFGLSTFGDEADRPDDLSFFSLTSEARSSDRTMPGCHRHERTM